ncbi:fungal-specific transcription factor domain-containing protein [Trichophaea hybrida]|nr:fungal-specific transcription factor domain-containing protein [Trichophaea hybrida]
MPRAPVVGREIRRRSRNGCWNCKARKVKCGEEKPRCSNCERLDEDCDYKIRLSWGGRPLKKKLQENGGNGHDQNGDDQSQFIPGAGQFSLNQHFPAPQTFIQASPSNSTARKPPVPRAGSGKKTSMSGYQTVFAVGEMPAVPPVSSAGPSASAAASTSNTHARTPSNATTTPQVDPQLTIQIPIPPSQQTPRPERHAQRNNSRDERTNSFGWQTNLTPITTTSAASNPLASPFDDSLRNDQTDRAFFSPYTSTSGQFSPTHDATSPITSFHSPPGHSSSPDIPYAQPHNSPQQKSFHPPPPIITSPTKKARTSTSPTQPPPMSPYIYTRHPMTSAPQLTASLAEAIDFMNTTPVTSAPMTMAESYMDLPAVTTVGMSSNTVMRRVSVENLLAVPLSHNGFPGAYDDRYGYMNFKTEDVSQYSPNDQGLEDDDIEEIPRNDYEDGDFSMQVNKARQFFRMNSTYSDQMSIPRRLDPLPQWLLSNDQNKMYFHHYLKHTARLLVPHDCSENPFKHILPQMAVETDHLMNLLLAYSASHQARLLNRPEPTERIGGFIDETVRSLNVALNHPVGATSDASLATAIMLASYQIVSPNPFASSGLTWQTHLNAARRIIVSRGGAQSMHSGDTVSYFLVRWFAYLDLLGRLSGREIDEPVLSGSGKYWTNDNEDERAEYSVDCFFGFTTRCVAILHSIGELARQCEQERRSMSRGGREQNGYQWKPSSEVSRKARLLREELRESKEKSVGRCSHAHDNGYPDFHNTEEFDEDELLATNDTFHWAAEIHLYRRVLGYPSSHRNVQNAVALIVEAMHKVKQGGTAENCLLFPLFTAGCEAIDSEHREYTLQRMLEVEKTGLTQVKHARLLLQRVWKERVAWWEIVNGEFIG